MAVKPDKVLRSKRKTLSVSVNSVGEVIVRAPLRYTEEGIARFLDAIQAWILKHKARMASNGIHLPGSSLDGYPLLLLGQPHTIILTDGNRIRLDSERKTLEIPRGNAEERLRRWLKENARRIFAERVDTLSKAMGLTYQSLALSSARTTWGTCTGDNRLRLNFRLLYAPKAVIEYVIVHELTHTLHHDHSKAFWLAVERVIPDYQQRRKWLKDRGALLKIL
jgi:predicted metal-dependent hydrolase